VSYLPNPLNNYSTYSYNIALYMVNPTKVGNINDLSNKILIADNSKIANYNIQSVEQIHTVGNDIVRASYANRFDITITEPNGTTFFSKIVMSAQELQIYNHISAMYIIEITFPARDNQNKPTRYPSKFYYPVTFVTVTANIDKGGSTYNIVAYENSTTGYSYLNVVSKSTLSITGSTVGEVITELNNALNRAEEISWITDINTQHKNEYEITFDADTKDWERWPIESAGEKINSDYISTDGDKIIFNMIYGTDITEFIGIILKSTVEGKKIPAYSGGTIRANPSEPATSGASKIPYTYKVISNITNTQYDFLKNDYAKKINYKIKKHLATSLIVDPAYVVQSVGKPAEQQVRISSLRDSGMLRKRYDYLFTGRNTEVINLDMKLQNTFYTMTPVYGGQINDPIQNATQGNTPTAIQEKIKNMSQLKSRIVEFSRAISSRIDPFVKRELERQLENAKQEFQTMFVPEDILSCKSPIMPCHPDKSAQATTSGPNTNSNESSELMMGAVNANIQNSGDLLEIEINVKGDPYWLGKPNSFYSYSIADDLADYEIGGNMFYLRVNLPTNETANGRRLVQPDFTLTGVYRVINIISQFRNGMFTQFLKAYRDTSIQPELVLSELENNNNKTKPYSEPIVGPR
jgi:hypothetical protein